MDITPTLIYWITRLDALDDIAHIFVIFGLIIGLIMFPVILDDDFDDDAKGKLKTVQKMSFLVALAGILLATFVPTKKEMAAILVIPRIANNETVAEIGDGVKMLAVEWLEELRPKKEESK